MSILLFLIVLAVLVLVHEWGHFIVAKKSGMRVDEFGIGFPPKLFGIKRGETEYTLNLFPIGGFVKIYGEDADAAVDASDYARSFAGQSRLKQSAVLVAGVTMNILFAWLLFSIAFATGVRTTIDESAYTDTAELIVTSVVPNGPAANAKLPVGVTIESVTIDGQIHENLTPSQFSALIGAQAGKEIAIKTSKGSATAELFITPQAGVIPNAPERGALGVQLALVDTVRQPIHQAFWDGLLHTGESIKEITIGIFTLVTDAVRFNADLANVAGPIGIVGLVGEASSYGFTTLLMFTAFISLNLAVINLLPFPALDGGRLLFVIIEAIKGNAIHPRITQALNTAGFVLLMLLMIAVTWNDITRLW